MALRAFGAVWHGFRDDVDAEGVTVEVESGEVVLEGAVRERRGVVGRLPGGKTVRDVAAGPFSSFP